MKRIPLFCMASAMLLAASCSEEELVKKPAEPDTDIMFCVDTRAMTRTVYGEESESGIVVNWKNNDRIWIASPQCSHTSAQYKVEVPEDAPQNYADKIVKTGDMGVRWGEAESGYDFYSVYPSTPENSISVSGEGCTANMSISERQYCGISSLPSEVGANLNFLPDMNNAVMYAATKNRDSSPDPIPLRFEPFTTVLDVTVMGPSGTAGVQERLDLREITLQAPDGTTIAGNFSLDLAQANTQPAADANPVNPTVSALDGTNKISVTPLLWSDPNTPSAGKYVSLDTKNHVSARVKFFLIPQNGLTINSDWTITVTTSLGNFSKSLGDVKDGALKPGAIHKISLPHLDATGEWNYDAEKWITQLPDYKNIILSEITLPGAWGGNSSQYQGQNVTYSGLYNKGVRAFSVITRSAAAAGNTNVNADPVRVVDVGTGTGYIKDEQEGAYSGEGTTPIGEVMKTIIESVRSDEFAVLVLSYDTNGKSGYREKDFAFWLKGIYEAYNNLPDNIKARVNTTPVTTTTTVNDVLGKLVLKVNVDKRIPATGYENNIPAMLSYTDLDWESDHARSALLSAISWKNWDQSLCSNTTTPVGQLNPNSLYWNYSVSDKAYADDVAGGYMPTYSDRKNAILNIVRNSENTYNSGNHNVWFYVGCGGYATRPGSAGGVATNAGPFAKNMNSWILKVLEAKLNSTPLPDASGNPTGAVPGPSPLGMVMCNYITGNDTDYHGSKIIDAIIRINSTFALKHYYGSSSPTKMKASARAMHGLSSDRWTIH